MVKSSFLVGWKVAASSGSASESAERGRARVALPLHHGHPTSTKRRTTVSSLWPFMQRSENVVPKFWPGDSPAQVHHPKAVVRPLVPPRSHQLGNLTHRELHETLVLRPRFGPTRGATKAVRVLSGLPRIARVPSCRTTTSTLSAP